ncbi:MAG: alpha-glucan family phosphorylase [Candidatus Aminicenantes bacterium]|nr:alpha-glucan family phosphorylase [Candidatus Aminicenantes bacterium]
MKPTNGNAQIQALTAGLNRLARNLWWSWNPPAQGLFKDLSPRAWENLYHNPVAVLHEVSAYELRVRLMDPSFAAKAKAVLAAFDAYLKEERTWGRENAPDLFDHPVAYFSAEFGFHESLPITAGGLGILSADHAKSASDLGLGFVGVGLFYREGYFMQSVDHQNWQIESYPTLQPRNLPLEPVLDDRGEPVVGSVPIAAVQVRFRAWRANIGRVCVYLLDTDLPENEPSHRDLTRRVYGGDHTTRIMQELLLGVGGVRLLRALGLDPSVFHMNEGHAAFLTLELLREKTAAGLTFEKAWDEVRSECVFTTHTPVEAGHDRFSADLVEYAASRYLKSFPHERERLLGLGRVHPADECELFCMTVLALKGSRAANGVSELHGRVSRAMWHGLWPERTEAEVPIGHITNGVHVPSWLNGTTYRFWSRKAEGDWADRVDDSAFWAKVEDPAFVSDEELWAFRYELRRKLIEYCRKRLLIQGRIVGQGDFITYDALLDPDALTVGFARRFATYKRAPLVFRNFEAIVELAKDAQRPVQFVFAGKAHPRDDDGKRFIQQIIHLSKHTALKGSLVFIENYDVQVARRMISGCDVWLNNPRRPLEASGTSGQKCGVHGCLNLSIMDGWWREAYDGTNGFAIGPDSHPADVGEQDRVDAENLFRVLSEEVVPAFYERDASGLPRRWIKMIRNAVSGLTPRYHTRRMVQEYVTKYYLPR